MSTLDLDCPSCETLLELDAGFAGGVCRCDKCGALLRVPADPRRHRAERLHRADRPDRPDRPGDPTGAPDEPAEDMFTTDSGSTVRIERMQDVPTARRRRTGVRIATIIVFGFLVTSIVVATVGALLVMVRHGSTPSGPAMIDAATFDPDLNPYLIAGPNAVGLPITDWTVIVVDASGSSRPWLTEINRILRRGLTHAGGEANVQLIYATTGGPEAIHRSARQLSQWRAEDLADFQDGITPGGDAPLAPAFEQALIEQPARLILITGREMTSHETAWLESAVESRPRLVLDAINMDRHDDELQRRVRQRRGEYVEMSGDRLKRWYAEARPVMD